MLIAFYANLCEKTFQGLGIGSACLLVSSDGMTVMSRDPDVKVGYVCEFGRMFIGCVNMRMIMFKCMGKMDY